jgi:hypothetical protein
MGLVEEYIVRLLRSKNVIDVKYGLANVIYWGYARIPYGPTRVHKFINNTTDKQINRFQELLLNGAVPDMATIKNLHLPEFSGMPFISKVLMFLIR